jgi:hypothetical protein
VVISPCPNWPSANFYDFPQPLAGGWEGCVGARLAVPEGEGLKVPRPSPRVKLFQEPSDKY